MKRVIHFIMFSLCLFILISCQSKPKEMTVLDNINQIMISESEGYGSFNEKFFTTLSDSTMIVSFEHIMEQAKGEKMKNPQVPNYDLLVKYEDGSEHLLHLMLGEEGDKSALSYMGHDHTAYMTSSQDTKKIRGLIYD